MTSSKKLIITLDGPAGSGKSTTARLLAQRLGYAYLDTGAMYRAITLNILRNRIDPADVPGIMTLLSATRLDIQYENGHQRTLLNGADVSTEIRGGEVTKSVSVVSGLPVVRKYLREQQQAIGRNGGYVVDGRDIGSVVFPQADIKFYLTANLEERARRRLKEVPDGSMELTAMQREIERRDELDSTREESPLIRPSDAVVIDNSHMSVMEQVQLIIDHIQGKFGPSIIQQL